MDRSEVKQIDEREIVDLVDRLGLTQWRINVHYDLRDDDGANGICTRHVDYNNATIELDPAGLEDEAHVLKVLRHELFHVVLAPFDTFINAVRPLTERDETTAAILASVQAHAIEQAIICLERLYRGLTEDRPTTRPPRSASPTAPSSSVAPPSGT